MIKTITKHINSTDGIGEIYDTIRTGDYGAYTGGNTTKQVHVEQMWGE